MNKIENKKDHTKINTIKRLLFEKINKIGKFLAKLTKGKSEKTHITIKNEREVTTDIIDIQTILLVHYESLYATKLNNQEEMDKFLEIYNPPRLNHKELENLSRVTQ